MQHIFINQSEVLTPDFFTVYHTEDGHRYNRIENELNQNIFAEHVNLVKVELYKNGTKSSQATLADVIYKEGCASNNPNTASYNFV